MRPLVILITVVSSALFALISDINEQAADSSASGFVQDDPVLSHTYDHRDASALDTMSLMQGTNVRVDLSSDAPGFGHAATFTSIPRTKTLLNTANANRSLVDMVHHAVERFGAPLKAHAYSLVATASTNVAMLAGSGVAVTLLLALFTIALCATCLILVIAGKRDGQRPVGDPRSMSRWAPAPSDRHLQPDRPMLSTTNWSATGSQAKTTPHFVATSAEGSWASLPRPGSALSNFGAFTGSRGVASATANQINPQSGTSLASPADRSNLTPLALPRTPVLESRVLPPPLCPTLVLPVCEARFGVPMNDLAQLTSEGELGIVGMSGNTLLRATLRKVGQQRLLEICMPEANSAPRATVGPAMLGAKSLEIRGLKGAFYGMLEMRSSGACFVVKEGTTVLTIDGDTDSLQLQIRSGHGAELASVRCSTEPFGGVDHVEVRVEPGVDTVLVLSCVLAVLLLSPYPPE